MKTLTITVFLFAVSLNCKAQYISSVDYLNLFSYTLNDNTVNDVETKLTGLSSNWTFKGGKEDGDVLTIKWNYIPQNQNTIEAQFSINSIKRKDGQLVQKISYSFLDERWFKEYITAVKSVDGASLVYNERETDGVIRQIYQTSSTVHIFNKIPFNKRGIAYRYNVEMHYNLN